MAAPTFQAAGTGSETSCSWPSHQADDWGLLWVETASGTVTTPSGWTLVGTAANAAGSTSITLFKRLATSAAESAAALAGGSDHLWGVITTVRGADLTTPILAFPTVYVTSATTSGVAPGPLTTAADCLVIQGLAWVLDSAGPIASSWTNASLTSFTEQYDAGTATASGGGITLASGTLATAGMVAAATVTLTSTAYVAFALVVQPPVSTSDTGLQLSVAARNGMLDAIETEGGTSAIMKIRTGSAPATCATADSGTVLATLNLPSDYFAAAASGAKAKAGTWEDVSADNTGTAGHFRIYKSNGTTCFIQGTVTIAGGGGHLIVSTTSFTAGDTVTISSFSMTAPGA